MIGWIAGGIIALIMLRPAKILARGPSAGLVAQGNVSSPFGPRGDDMHMGIDIAAPEGTEVRAGVPGVVVDVAPDGQRTNYGNTVIVEHAGGVLTLYGHLKGFGPGISIGKVVQVGDVLGYVGTTQFPRTYPMKPHLHFEVLKGKVLWKGRIVVNPETPGRYEPQAWLRQKKRPVQDA